jgi:hypothetical protein
MNVSIEGLPGRSGARNAATRAALAIVALMLGACGSGSSTATTGPDPLASCDPADAATAPECSSVIVTFTDADGDFLNYTVDVLSLTLETANGRVVETLPRETRINCTDYVELTALESGTTIVPPGSGHTLYVIKTADSLRQYSDFAECAGNLVARLDGVTSARSMFARGQYDVDSNVFTAFKLGVYLLEP